MIDRVAPEPLILNLKFFFKSRRPNLFMRRGREYYGRKYEEALRLYKEGRSAGAIAKELGISYSAAYHWVRGLRKPGGGRVNAFVQFLKEKGPQPAEELGDFFPKHNDLFLIASRRGLPVKRLLLGRELKDYSTWYFLDGQEEEIRKRVGGMLEKIKEAKDKLRDMLGD